MTSSQDSSHVSSQNSSQDFERGLKPGFSQARTSCQELSQDSIWDLSNFLTTKKKKNSKNLEQLYEIFVNSGIIFTVALCGKENVLPLFSDIDKNNCVTIYTLSDVNNFFRTEH